MTLTQAIDSYVFLKRALGAVFSADTRILRSFARALGDIPLDTIDAAAIHAFCRGTGPPTRWWERKHQALNGFFAYLVTRGHLTASPLSEPAPRIARSFQPYIYSRNELQRLLDATTVLEDNRWPLQKATFRTLLLTLYGAGLRPSEGLHLRCCDVDLEDSLLTIWDTKFFKSRLVPIGPRYARRFLCSTKPAETCQYRAGCARPSSHYPTAARSRSINLRRFLSGSASMPESTAHRARAGNRGFMICATPLSSIG